MEEKKILRGYAERLEKCLRLKTFPVAVKLLKSIRDVPKGAVRPKKDFGQHMALCVALSMSRRGETVIAMLKEDMWCFDPVIGFGLAEPPEYFLEGHNRFPESMSTSKAAKNWSSSFPRLECGKYIGILNAPLKNIMFEPDIIIIYCDTAQLTQLLMAVNWKEGEDVTPRLSGVSACVYATIPTIQTRDYWVTSPCVGDSKHAMSQDNEMLFTTPAERLSDLMAGLEYLEKNGYSLPRNVTAELEYKISVKYQKIGKMIGMDV